MVPVYHCTDKTQRTGEIPWEILAPATIVAAQEASGEEMLDLDIAASDYWNKLVPFSGRDCDKAIGP